MMHMWMYVIYIHSTIRIMYNNVDIVGNKQSIVPCLWKYDEKKKKD